MAPLSHQPQSYDRSSPAVAFQAHNQNVALRLVILGYAPVTMSCSLRGETEIRSVFQANNYQNMFTQRACLNLYHTLFTNTHAQVMSQGYVILSGKYNTTPTKPVFGFRSLLHRHTRKMKPAEAPVACNTVICILN